MNNWCNLITNFETFKFLKIIYRIHYKQTKGKFPKSVVEREKILHVTFNRKQIQNVGNERGETFIRDVKKLHYTDEYRAMQETAYLVYDAYTCIRWLNFDISRAKRDSCFPLTWRHSPIQLGGSRARIRVSEKIRYAGSCPLNEAYILNIIHFETPMDLVLICTDSEDFYCYLISSVIIIEMEQRVIFSKRVELCICII